MNTHEKKPQKPLKDALFERIEQDKVCPHSRLFFHSRECFVWFFWFLSVVVGALAFAVTFFVLLHQQYALYEATHSNFLTFIVDALPYLWIFVFALMVYVAVYNLRHTKRGYRYPLWMIMASSVVLSFAGGSAFHLFGLGHSVDYVLGQHTKLYTSQDKYEQKIWQNPADGRLLGIQVHSTLAPTTTIIFEDYAGVRWTMDISELPEADIAMIATKQKVKLLGKAVREDLRLFHACGTFPWVSQRDMTVEVMNAQRQMFVERVYEHARKADEQRLHLATTFASTTLPKQSVCATIPLVRRVSLE
jgi:hypothetical protein